MYFFFPLEYFSKVLPIKEFQLILLAAMEWKTVLLVPLNQWNIPREALSRSCTSKKKKKKKVSSSKIKAQQKDKGKITEMCIGTKVFPQNLCFYRIFNVSCSLYLFLLLGSREKRYCFCRWLYGRCPYVQCIGWRSAGGAFSCRWCPIFSLTSWCHDVDSPQELMAGLLFCLEWLQSPGNPLISINYLQQPQDIQSTFCLRRNVRIMEMSPESVGMFMLHLLHQNIKIPNCLTDKESSCESTEI